MLITHPPEASKRVIMTKPTVSVLRTITTKHFPATTYKGARIKATNGDATIIIGYYEALEHCGPASSPHRYVAQCLADKLNWGNIQFGGSLPDNNPWDYVFGF